MRAGCLSVRSRTGLCAETDQRALGSRDGSSEGPQRTCVVSVMPPGHMRGESQAGCPGCDEKVLFAVIQIQGCDGGKRDPVRGVHQKCSATQFQHTPRRTDPDAFALTGPSVIRRPQEAVRLQQ
jgi:hypothetical protein